MRELECRPIEACDEDGYASVRSLAYHDGLPVPEDRLRSRYSDRFVAALDGRIAGIFDVLAINSTRGPALLPCAGVAGVAVSPDMRRAGVGHEMMDWAVRYFSENGFALAALYAYREPFYARSGYITVGRRMRLSVPTHRFPKVHSDLPIRRLTPADWALLHPCYKAFGHQRSGVHVRSELMWGRVLNENKPLTIYAAGDPVEGYIAVSHKVDFWVEQWISEVAWSTPEGYRAALDLIKGICSNKSGAAWLEPSDSPFYAQYLDQGVEMKLDRPAMFRVCDVPGALCLLKPAGKGSFSVRVRDAQVPANEGPWRVAWTEGVVAATKSSANPDLEMDITAFTQAFMGEPSLAEVLAQGRVLVRNREAISQATELLPALPVFCGDFF